MHPLTACQGRRCTEQRGRKTWMVGEGGCNPVRKSRALCEANRFFHNAQCVAMPRSRPAMVDFGYDPPSVASGGDAPQAMRMQQVMHDRVQQADRPHRSDPMNQHPPEPTVLHLAICVLGQLAPPIHLLATVACHAGPPILHRLRFVSQLRATVPLALRCDRAALFGRRAVDRRSGQRSPKLAISSTVIAVALASNRFGTSPQRCSICATRSTASPRMPSGLTRGLRRSVGSMVTTKPVAVAT